MYDSVVKYPSRVHDQFYEALRKGLVLVLFSVNVILVLQHQIPKEDSSSLNLQIYFEETLKFPVERPRFDNKRIVQIYDHVRTGWKWMELRSKFDVCMATQTSIERLYWIPQILENWRAPLSLAIYIIQETEWIVFNIYSIFLERCYPSFASQVSVHFALPSKYTFPQNGNLPPNITDLVTSASSRPCKDYNDTKEYLQDLLEEFRIPTVHDKDKDLLFEKAVYPQNHLRNIARKGCPTKWTYSVDVDIIPNIGQAEMLQAFYESVLPEKCEKCAYVIPTFELDYNRTFPKSKFELVDCYRNGSAKSLNQFFKPAQKATEFDRWCFRFVNGTVTKVSHEISKNSMYYEPFYVGTDDIAAFDERFLGYGLTRSSQFQEALLSGWNFTVLTPVFGIHWGIHKAHNQTSKGPIADQIREKQRKKNGILFKKFMKEIKLKKTEKSF